MSTEQTTKYNTFDVMFPMSNVIRTWRLFLSKFNKLRLIQSKKCSLATTEKRTNAQQRKQREQQHCIKASPAKLLELFNHAFFVMPLKEASTRAMNSTERSS